MNDSVLGSAVDQQNRPRDRSVCVCVPAVQGIESNLRSAASGQSESDIVTELEGKCVEWGCYYWMGAICYATCQIRERAHTHTGVALYYILTHISNTRPVFWSAVTPDVAQSSAWTLGTLNLPNVT